MFEPRPGASYLQVEVLGTSGAHRLRALCAFLAQSGRECRHRTASREVSTWKTPATASVRKCERSF